MVVSSRLNPILEWIRAQVRLEFLSDPVSLPDETPRCGFRWNIRADEVLPRFEIGKFVGGRKRGTSITLPFALDNLGQWLVGHAALGIIAC